MILDAETFDQVAAVDRILRGVEGVDLPGAVEVRALRVGLRDEHRDLRERRRGGRRAARASPGRRRGRGTRGAGDRGGGERTRSRSRRRSRSSRRSATSRSSAYGGPSVRRQGVQGLHVHVGMPTADACWQCLEAILPWLPVVLALSANSPWFAGELTGHGVEPRTGARRAAPCGRAAGVRLLRGVGVVGRAPRPRSASPRTTRGSGGTSVRIRSSGRSRCASPTSPPTFGCSTAFAALLQALCATALDGALPERRRCSATAAAPTTPRTAGRQRASARVRSCCTPTARARAPAAELGAELLELRAPGGASARRARTHSTGSTRAAARPSCSSERVAARRCGGPRRAGR